MKSIGEQLSKQLRGQLGSELDLELQYRIDTQLLPEFYLQSQLHIYWSLIEWLNNHHEINQITA